MRSILADAQEEVPAHVWEGISAELDRIDAAKSGRPFMLWMRRGAVAVAAAAAVTVGVFMNNGGEEFVPEAADSETIAVVEPVSAVYTAEVRLPSKKPAAGLYETTVLPDEVSMAASTEVATPVEMATAEKATAEAETKERPEEGLTQTWTEEGWTEEDWTEDTKSGNRIRTSIVLSGITGTNGIQRDNSNGVLRLPSISTIRPKTGIKQTKEDSSFGLPLSVGAGVKIGFTPRWSMGIGLNYTLLTRKFHGYYTHVDAEGNIEVSPSSDIRNSQHYIGIPVNFYYNIVDRDNLHFYAYAGGTVEKCVSDRYDVLGQNIVHREKAKGVQCSADVGVGVEFLLGKHLGLYIDPSLRYYFPGSQPKSIRTIQPLMMGFEMGLRINL